VLLAALLPAALPAGCRGKAKPTRAGAAVAAALASGPVVHSQPGLIVVLGSSTSAGTGPSDPENAWVPRYRAYLRQRFPAFGLTNLAVGGFTTYHVQPSDFIPPAGRPAPVAGKNITAALALTPDAIIVNLPSNDAAARVPIAEQLANYERIGELAKAAHVPLWVTTSQPRNFGEASQRALLTQASAGIERRFAPRVLDFWTPFADAAGRILPEHDSGDGTHLNDAAHARLVEIVVAAQLPEAVLRPR
jgi:lysophospholipase L1-like esterase